MLQEGDTQTNRGMVGAAAARLGTTLPPRLGAVSFLLRPRVSALGTNELRRRARRGLHDTAPRWRRPPCPALQPGAQRTPVLSSCWLRSVLSDLGLTACGWGGTKWQNGSAKNFSQFTRVLNYQCSAQCHPLSPGGPLIVLLSMELLKVGQFPSLGTAARDGGGAGRGTAARTLSLKHLHSNRL